MSATYLQVVGVLPHVNAKDGHLAADDGVLVLGRNDTEALCVLDEPAPTASLQAQKGLAKSGLESVQAAPDLVDVGNQSWGTLGVGVGGAGRGEVLPEERVVYVASTIELDGSLEGDLAGDVVGGGGSRVRLEGVV